MKYDNTVLGRDNQNPVITGLFADPDIAYFDGKYYIYPTTDGYYNWSGHSFYVFSSEDGIHYTKEGQILDVATEEVKWASGHAWAPCIARREGRYYFYFCAKDKRGISGIGIASSKSPIGPFCAEEKPLLTLDMMQERNIDMNQVIDPSIYQEGEDYYILFGNGIPAIAKLSKDMTGIDMESLQVIEGALDFTEAITVFKRDTTYHFTWSCNDTRSEDYHVKYGTSTSLYGPITYHGIILEKEEKEDILGTGHHSILHLPEEDKYLIAYHRFAKPLEKYPEGKGFHRETCIGQLEFARDGRLLPVKPRD